MRQCFQHEGFRAHTWTFLSSQQHVRFVVFLRIFLFVSYSTSKMLFYGTILAYIYSSEKKMRNTIL
jgi:hypothetical protein